MRKPGYIFPSLVLADIIMESEFLSWHLCKETVAGRYANNLTKIEVDKTWAGKSIDYEGRTYKTYRDWLHFASDYSDILCFSDKYDTLLTQPTLKNQIHQLAYFKADRRTAKARLTTFIDFYNLTEID